MPFVGPQPRCTRKERPAGHIENTRKGLDAAVRADGRQPSGRGRRAAQSRVGLPRRMGDMSSVGRLVLLARRSSQMASLFPFRP